MHRNIGHARARRTKNHRSDMSIPPEFLITNHINTHADPNLEESTLYYIAESMTETTPDSEYFENMWYLIQSAPELLGSREYSEVLRLFLTSGDDILAY